MGAAWIFSFVQSDVVKHRLDKPLHVYGAFTLDRGKLTFQTGDPALTQQLQTDRNAGRASTLCLLDADPSREITGVLESVALVKVDRPQQWRVVMVEQRAARR